MIYNQVRKVCAKSSFSIGDGHVKSTETITQGSKYRMMAEKKDKKTILYVLYSQPSFLSKVVFLCAFISALFLYFLPVHPYLK